MRPSEAAPIVITGARGYIGSALVRQFVDAGQALRLVSRLGDTPILGARNSADVSYVQADLCGEEAWSRLMTGVVTIVHLSSRTDLRAAETDPAGDEEINVEPVRALVRAAARSGSRPKVIFASTVTIVGVGHDNPVDETTPDRPCSVYDRHKLVCETLLREATVSGYLRACNLRLSNVYGYGRSSVNANRGILNAMMRRAANGEPPSIYGDGKYVRDFTYLDDVVEAFFAAAASERVCDGSHYVIATGQGHSLAEAFDMVADEALMQTGNRIIIQRTPEPADLHPIERRNFVGNSSLFEQLTGWRPRFDLRAGIRDSMNRMTKARAIAAGR